jgi:inner membrane protein involved in colicin E2 resistance
MKKKKIILISAIVMMLVPLLLMASFINAKSRATDFVESQTQDYILYESSFVPISLNRDIKFPGIYWSFMFDHKYVFDQFFSVEVNLLGQIIYPTEEWIKEYWKETKPE